MNVRKWVRMLNIYLRWWIISNAVLYSGAVLDYWISSAQCSFCRKQCRFRIWDAADCLLVPSNSQSWRLRLARKHVSIILTRLCKSFWVLSSTFTMKSVNILSICSLSVEATAPKPTSFKTSASLQHRMIDKHLYKLLGILGCFFWRVVRAGVHNAASALWLAL